MVNLEMLEDIKNRINEIKERCLEILKFKIEHDKHNLIISDELKNFDFSNLDNIQNIVFTNLSIKFFIDCSTIDEYKGYNYESNFEELINENWKERFLKELEKEEVKFALKEQEKIEQLLLKEKEEYKKLKEKFEREQIND